MFKEKRDQNPTGSQMAGAVLSPHLPPCSSPSVPVLQQLASGASHPRKREVVLYVSLGVCVSCRGSFSGIIYRIYKKRMEIWYDITYDCKASRNMGRGNSAFDKKLIKPCCMAGLDLRGDSNKKGCALESYSHRFPCLHPRAIKSPFAGELASFVEK